MRFLHCSDVHVTGRYFSTPFLKLGWRRWIALWELTVGGRAKIYAHAESTLHQLVEDFERLQVDHLLASGDLTAYALEEEFERAVRALSPLSKDPARCSAIPGNHDTYTPGARRTQRFERHFGHLAASDLPEHTREDGFPFVKLLGAEDAVVGLRSARVPPVPGLSYGYVGRRQLDGLAALLQDPRLAQRAILVMVHHAPLRANGKRDSLSHGLIDARALLELLRGPRFALLHGHIHRRYCHPASAERPFIVGAGSSTEKGKEGYWVIDTAGGEVRSAAMYAPGGSTPLQVAAARSG